MVLPNSPSAAEIALYLQLMSHFGSQTGYPGTRITVTGPSNVISPASDYLVIGTIADQPAFDSLAPILPATLDGAGIHVKPRRGLLASVIELQGAATNRWASLMGKPATGGPSVDQLSLADALIEEIQSPVSPDHSIVTITLRQDSSADPFVTALLDLSRPKDTGASMILLKGSGLESLPSGAAHYQSGSISTYARMRIILTEYYYVLMIVALALSFLCARYLYAWMAWRAQERLKLAALTDHPVRVDETDET